MPLGSSELTDCGSELSLGRSELAWGGSELSLRRSELACGRSELSSLWGAGSETTLVRSVLLTLRQFEFRSIWSELIVFRTEALAGEAVA